MEMRNCYRDITVKEIGEEQIGRILRVAGWVENRAVGSGAVAAHKIVYGNAEDIG